MMYSNDKAAFGRHESFPLRFSWLTKGFSALGEDPGVFISQDATVTLGVGKNMVNSIRYWLQAARIIELKKGAYYYTPVGVAIFGEKDGYDPYLEDEATIWLLHWLIATNPNIATAWYWFFNRYHKPQFTNVELATALLDFTKQNLTGKFSATTVKQDAAVLLRMYVRSKGNTRTPIEEALDSPLSLLGLISQVAGSKNYYSRPEERPGLPVGVLGYAILELLKERNIQQVPIEELMYSNAEYPAPGAVFRLTENALLTKLEKLSYELPGIFELRETAGIHQLYLLDEMKPLDMLEHHYAEEAQEVAA